MPKRALGVSGLCLGFLVAAGPATTAAAGGAGWVVVTTPDQGTATSANVLESVSCVSAASCVAVGNAQDATQGYLTLVEHWNGRAWALVASPSAGTTSADNELDSVSCATPNSCMAVGSADAVAIAEHWDGAKWSLTVLGAGGIALTGVSCYSPNGCVAVGDKGPKTLVETWAGSKWATVPSPNKGTASGYTPPAHDMLNAVSCVSAKSCTAVGDYVATSGAEQTLVESWDGAKWSIAASPSPGPRSLGELDLNGVSCASPSDCVAVGDYEGTAPGYRTLVESWDGAKWSIAASPSPGKANFNDSLGAVSCTSSRSCAAVGYQGGSAVGGGSALAETWNGMGWQVAQSPTPGATASGLAGVSCSYGRPCMAVGYESVSSVSRALAEQS